MFGRRFDLFNLFGIPIRIDLSWFVIVILITWSLAEGVFTQAPMFEELQAHAALRWAMGIAGALGLFASIVLHELGHAKTAESQGVPMKGITLFIFGGVAELSKEPPSARAEFLVAIAGPIVSLILGVVGLGIARAGYVAGWPIWFVGVVGYLGLINLILVAFNMIPAFPLDGGRILRSIIWHYSNNLEKATRITSRIGSGFGLAMMILAAFQLLVGNLIGAVWWFLIGMFLRNAAMMSYQRLIMLRHFKGESVRRFMHQGADTVNPGDSVRDLVENHIYRHHHKMYPVVEDGQIKGCVTLDRVKHVEQDQWDDTRVDQLLEPCGEENTIDVDADATDALSRMSTGKRSRLMVLDQGRLVGIIAIKDLMNFLGTKIELEGDGRASRAVKTSQSSNGGSHPAHPRGHRGAA